MKKLGTQIGLDLLVPKHFSYPLRRGCKKSNFFTPPFCNIAWKYYECFYLLCSSA